MLRLGRASRSPEWPSLRVEQLEGRALLSGVTLLGSPAGAQGPLASLEVRKNQSSLTKTEKLHFIDAIKTLKTTFNPGSTISVYDQFVFDHYTAFSAGHAHEGPAFLAWHREFLLQFEQELQKVDSTVTIPYWDFTVDNSADSSIWKFMGGNGDPNDNHVVKTGPFRQGEWTLAYDGPDLRRDFGGLVSTLPTADDVRAAFNVTQYDAFPFDSGSPIDQSFRNNIEGLNHPTGEAELHNRVHNWIGGSMAIPYSPNDPVFWLLHANIDRIWAEWEDQNGQLYDPTTGAAYGHNLNDLMSPFNVTPASVLDERALGYRYDTQSESGGGSSPLAVPAGGWGNQAGPPHGTHPGAPPGGDVPGPVGDHGPHLTPWPTGNHDLHLTAGLAGDHGPHLSAAPKGGELRGHAHPELPLLGVDALTHAGMVAGAESALALGGAAGAEPSPTPGGMIGGAKHALVLGGMAGGAEHALAASGKGGGEHVCT